MEMKEGKAKNIIFKTYCTRHSAMVCTNIVYVLYERAERDQGKQTNKQMIKDAHPGICFHVPKQIREDRKRKRLLSPFSVTEEDSLVAVSIKNKAHERTGVSLWAVDEIYRHWLSKRQQKDSEYKKPLLRRLEVKFGCSCYKEKETRTTKHMISMLFR